MNDTAYEQTDREPIPRAWREEFDGLKPIKANRVQIARRALRWAGLA